MGVPYAPNIREWPYLCNGWSDPLHVWFQGRVFGLQRIERRYLRFEQIQDGGHRHVGKISSGVISATSRPIHLIFFRMGFSGTADLMALFPVRTNPRWRPPPSWIISNGHISTDEMAISQQLTIYLYSAHRAVIFAIAQLSCNLNKNANLPGVHECIIQFE